MMLEAKKPYNSTLNRGEPSLMSGTGRNSKRKPQYQIMEELSELIAKQNKKVLYEMTSVSESVEQMANLTRTNTITSERIHDRLESLILEQRATNILLSQLISIHSSVMGSDNNVRINNKAENIRLDVYDRVLRGQ